MAEQHNTNHSINSVANHDYWAKKFWSNFLHYIKSFDALEPTQLNKDIENEITDFSFFLTNFASLKSNFLRASAHKHFSKNSADFIETYHKILKEIENSPDFLTTFSPHKYSYNKNLFREQYVVELLAATRNLNPDLTPGSQNEFNQLHDNLKKCDNTFEKRQKQAYISLLVRLGDFLKKLNLIEEYSNTYNSMLSMYGLKALSYPPHVDEKNCKSIDTILTENYLNNLTLPRLTALTGFWINKSAKAIVTLNEMLFIVNEFDLWNDVIAQKKQIPITDEQLKTILDKTSYLSQAEETIFNIMETMQFNAPTANQEEINNIFNSELNKKIAKEKTRYKKRFDSILPNSKNDLKKDIYAFHEMSNTRYLLYRLKDMCIFNLLMGSIDNHYSRNWGIVPNDNPNSKFVNVTFDLEGLNMPLRLHIYQSELTDFLKKYTGEPIIPLYKGANDMTIYGHYISSAVFAPTSKKQNSFVTEQLANPSKLPPDIANFLKHLKFLKDSTKLPITLKNESPNKPNAVNLETGEKTYIPSKDLFR